MKVKEFVDKLNKIGYDENTELTFDSCDCWGEIFEFNIGKIFYGEDLTGKPYNNDIIDIEIKTYENEDYMNNLKDEIRNELKEMLINVLYNE